MDDRDYRWFPSEQPRHDPGEEAVRRWISEHWNGYLRSKWLEHLRGTQFWSELDRGDFGLLQRRFQDQTELLDQILDRFKAGKANLDILLWAQNENRDLGQLIEILEALDINSRRLSPDI